MRDHREGDKNNPINMNKINKLLCVICGFFDTTP